MGVSIHVCDIEDQKKNLLEVVSACRKAEVKVPASVLVDLGMSGADPEDIHVDEDTIVHSLYGDKDVLSQRGGPEIVNLRALMKKFPRAKELRVTLS